MLSRQVLWVVDRIFPTTGRALTSMTSCVDHNSLIQGSYWRLSWPVCTMACAKFKIVAFWLWVGHCITSPPAADYRMLFHWLFSRPLRHQSYLCTFGYFIAPWTLCAFYSCINCEASRNIYQEHLNSFPLENWRRPPGLPRTTWMKTIQQDLKSNNLSLNEAIDVAHNRPLWRLMSTFGTTAVLVVDARTEWINNWEFYCSIIVLSRSLCLCKGNIFWRQRRRR